MQPGRAQAALDHRRHRAFAVRAADVDRRPGVLRVAERRENGADVVEAEFDPELLEREESFEGSHPPSLLRSFGETGPGSLLRSFGGTGPSAVMPPPTAGLCMKRNTWPMVAFISRRSTTRSSMPRSSRNSLRWKPSGSFWRIVCSITRGPAKPINAL